jgi:hypothetical protein
VVSGDESRSKIVRALSDSLFSYLMLELQAAKIVAASGESRGAIDTTTPRSSPLSASTMTKSPGLIP